MAIYKVQAPDGSILEIEGPEGATDAQIGQAAQAAYAERQRETGIAGGARDVLAGLVRGAGTIGSAIVEAGKTVLPEALGGQPAATYVPRFQQRGREISKGLETLTGADIEGLPYKIGAVGGEMAGTLGLLSPIAATMRALKVSPALVKAYETGGLAKTGAAKPLADYATRIVGGAGAGATGAAVTAPEDIGTVAAIGAAIPGVGLPIAKTLGGIKQTVQPFLQPQLAAERQLYKAAGGTPGAAERTIAEIEAGRQVPTTPGFQPTLPELMVAGGGEAPPTIAVLAERLRGSTPTQASEIQQLMNQRVGALQAQLARVNQQIDQQGAMLPPGALDELTQARNAILKNLENDQAELESLMRTSAGRLPTGPQETGEEIAARAKQLSETLKKTTVQPAYAQAEAAAGNAKVNIDAVVAEAEKVLGRPLSSFSPDTAPAIVRRIMALRPAPVQEPNIGLLDQFGRPMPTAPAPMPVAEATLTQLDDLRKAINSDVLAAGRGQGSLAGIETRNLLGLQRKIDEAIDVSDTLPQPAKDLYGKALATYREQYAPRFRTGETAKILKPGMFGEQRIEPAQIVQQFTKDTDAAKQFVTTFAGDAPAYESLKNGILGQFRQAAVDAQTGLVNPGRAAKFLQDNAEQFAVLDNAGLGIRKALQQFEQEAIQGNQAISKLADIGGPFKDKTPDQILQYILGSRDRMGVALARSDAAGRDAIQRVVQTRLNQMLTQTPGGEPLTEAGVMKVVGELLDQTGKLKPAYEMALGRDLANQFADRAQGLRLVIETSKDQMLKNPNAIEPVLRAQNFKPEQLTDIQLVIDDLTRMRKVADAARAARASARPTGRDVLGEQMEEGVANPLKVHSLNQYYTAFRNVLLGVKNKLNAKVSAKLANMVYNNPDEAIAALKNELARVQSKAKPAGVSRVAPATYGGLYSGASTQTVDVLRPEEQENQ